MLEPSIKLIIIEFLYIKIRLLRLTNNIGAISEYLVHTLIQLNSFPFVIKALIF